MKKQEAIKQYLTEPLKVGDKISYTGAGNGSQNKSISAWGDVTKIEDGIVYFDGYYKGLSRLINEVKKVTYFIGENPFIQRKRIISYQIDIGQLLTYCGINIYNDFSIQPSEYLPPAKICSFDPHVVDFNGKEVYYQRGLIWTLEQKQLLIDSIFNGVDIGKFLFRKRSWKYVEQRVNNNLSAAFRDLVDGISRVSAIIDFVRGEFSSSNGIIWSELSELAQQQFLGYRNLQYCEMDENTTDKEVQTQFLMVNHAGVPMSKEHLKFVKSIKL